MSSNTSKGKAIKGSKYWMRTIINSDMKMELESKINVGEINWISPLDKDDYSEYKLNQKNIVELIQIPKTFYSFWPTNQPQWDAIGITEDTIILVEAKAHLKELNSSLSAINKENKSLIHETMGNVFDKYYSEGNFEAWIETYYQMGNRLTFLKLMNDLVNNSGRQVKLVLLNIVNDPAYISTSEDEWNNSYENLFMDMIGESTPPNDIIMINFNVSIE